MCIRKTSHQSDIASFTGFLAEFDSPKRLLENDKSLFAKLVAEYWTQAKAQSGA